MFKWFKIIDLNESKKKNRMIFYINGIYLLVLKINNKFFAFEDNCPHQNMPINKGKILNNEIIICPFHNAFFCIKTGLTKKNLSIDNLNTFKLKFNQNSISIKIFISC